MPLLAVTVRSLASLPSWVLMAGWTELTRSASLVAACAGRKAPAARANRAKEAEAAQRAMWASFTPMALFTLPVAAHLVRFGTIRPGEAVLDVGTYTGVVALT